MNRDYLPLGSVVILKEGIKKLMICGRIQVLEGSDKIYDYSACLFPEGLQGPDSLFFFNDEDIDRLTFVGSQDEDELKYSSSFLSQLGELEIRDGKIMEKESKTEK